MVAHPGIPAARVGYVVRRQWVVDVTTVDPLPMPARSRPPRWHWVLGDDDGPRWFATVHSVSSPEARAARLAAFEASAQVGQSCGWAVTPVHTRDARVAVDVLPGLLLSLTPYLEGVAAPVPADDSDRCEVASVAGELHGHVRPRALPRWEPGVGDPAGTARADLERCLDLEVWDGGPWSGPAGQLVAEAAPVVRQGLRRLALLGAAVRGSVDRWVVTHGELDGGHLLHTPDGVRVVGWGSLALAPRERDLLEALVPAEGSEPWFAYLEAGGTADPLSIDTVRVFALQRHLSAVAADAVALSGPHGDTEDERDRFAGLERGLASLQAVLETGG